MDVYIGVPTVGRAEVLRQTIATLRAQTKPPTKVVVCTPRGDSCDLSREFPDLNVVEITSEKGSCAQRNAIMDYLVDQEGVLLIIDDDFLLHPTYLEKLGRVMSDHPDIALANGTIIKDGISGPGLSFEEAEQLLAEADSLPAGPLAIANGQIAYGCNMAIRLDLAKQVRFDENLPLYGWQEDVDFSFNLSSHGRIVKLSWLSGVHLGVKTGRTSGVKFGYSQISNPLYLQRKGTMATGHVCWLIGKNVLSNIAKALRPESYIDRRGRLKGNCLALIDVLRGRDDPKRVLRL
jgi:GT2 family glycosyltransferase